LLGAVLFCAAPFVHMDFDKVPTAVKDFKKEVVATDAVYKTKQLELRKLYNTGAITGDVFITDNDLLTAEISVYEKQNAVTLRKLVDDNRVCGFRTLRSFLIGFGIRLPYLFFSVVILLLSLQLPKKPYITPALAFLTSVSVFISVYLITWFLWDSDFPKYIYHSAIAVISILLSVSVIYGLLHVNVSFKKRDRIIKNWIGFTIKAQKNIITPLVESTNIQEKETLAARYDADMWKNLDKTTKQ